MSGEAELAGREQFTARETEILRLVAEGLSNCEIAETLVLSLNTVKWYNNQIYSKLGVASRVQALARARQLGLLGGGIGEQGMVAGHNLPAQITPFIGREAELAELQRMLDDPALRLVTILGLGGMGKTRLAIETAQRRMGRYPDGVTFIPLAPLSSAEQILPALADALGFQFGKGDDPRQQVLDYLSARHMLLLFDNFEHVLTGAGLLAELLKAAPSLKIIVTSHERLNLSGETVYAIGGMDYSGAQLFLLSAQRVQAGFEIGPEDEAAIRHICRLVGGMPLGIVLAAAWVPLLSLEQIAAEIEQGLDILEGQSRDAPQRHQSLRVVFEHSWALLSVQEQAMFRRLSVFRGGFSLEAAQALSGAGLRTLRALLDKSLIQRVAAARFDIHELLRQFGAEKLRTSGEETAARQAHRDYFADFVRQQWQRLQSDEQVAALQAIDRDFDNLRAAWLMAAETQHIAALRQMDDGLGFFMAIRCRYFEALDLLQQAADSLQSAPAEPQSEIMRWRIQTDLGAFYSLLGHDAQAKRLLETSLAHLRRVGDADSVLLALTHLAGAVGYIEGWPSAQPLNEEALQMARDTGDRSAQAHFLKNIGRSYRDQQDYPLAMQVGQEALQIAEEIGDQFEIAAIASSILGEVAILSGDYEAAATYVQRGLAIYEAMHYSFGISAARSRLGRIATAREAFDEARQWFLDAMRHNHLVGMRRELLFSIFDMARLALAQGEQAQAAELLTFVLEHPLARATWLIEQGGGMLESLAGQLAADVFAAAAARGRTLDLDTLVAQLLDDAEAS